MASIILEAYNNSHQSIKLQVQPNEVLRDLLKKFCNHFKLNLEEYSLFYKNKELDLGLQFRFSSILQNSRIQVKKVKKSNDEVAEVNIALQFEGGRFTRKFKTNTTLWDILVSAEQEKNVKLLHRDYLKKNENKKYYVQTMVQYISTVIDTNKDLRKTTLFSLSIRSGSGLLRVSFKETEYPYDEFIEQDKQDIENEHQETAMEVDEGIQSTIEDKDKMEVEELDERSRKLREQMILEEQRDRLRLQEEIEEELKREQERERKKAIEEEVSKKQKKIKKLTITEEKRNEDKNDNDPFMKELFTKGGLLDKKVSEVHSLLRTIDQEEIDSIPSEPCPRDMKVFKPNESEFKPSNVEFPDDFYEPTTTDFNINKENKEEVLKTSHMRKKEYLKKISRFKKCLIRIKFPDNYSIQGTFYPQETTEHVMNFVRENLVDPNIDFYLYTTPPIEPLHMTKNLRDQQLVPAAQVYFGLKGNAQVLPSPLIKLDGVEVTERVYNDNSETKVETKKGERRKPKSKSEEEEVKKKIISKMFKIGK